MLAPERRGRADLLAAGVITVLIVVATAVVWLHSDARGTTSITANTPAAQPKTALSVPETLQERWRAASGATRTPVVSGGAVVSADDGTVTGRDPATGNELWRYQRNMPLCGIEGAWGTVVAVYRDRRGCSQVTELDGASGARRAARTSQADDSVALRSDGTYIESQGSDRLELWRSDLVRTLEYGYVDAPVNPNAQPRTGCTLESSASSGTRLAVLERCPQDPTDRLTVLNPSPKDSQKPEEYGSQVLTDIPPGATGARVLAAYGDRIAVYLPGDGASVLPRLGIYDTTAKLVAQHLFSAPIGPDPIVSRAGSAFLVWTGSTVVALRTADLAPVWSAIGALGPGALMAGRVLVPVADGLVVLDPATGQEVGRVPVQRNDFSGIGPITLNVVGTTVLEQRDSDLVALG